MTTVEILQFPPSKKYATGKIPDLPSNLFAHLRTAAPADRVRVTLTARYHGESDWLMLYGPGGLDRQAPMNAQLRRRGTIVCWDAPYWARGTKLRVSINHAHPQAWVMRRTWPDDRLKADGITTTDTYDPNGPIIVAGLGAKAKAQYGPHVVEGWEADKVRECLTRWPMRRILYRPKPHHDAPTPLGIQKAPDGPIEQVLRGASLVITWHSNVGVDAIRCGIPVVCHDGAAGAVYPAMLRESLPPISPAERDAFLANLAWFQWAPSEARQIWDFLLTLIV